MAISLTCGLLVFLWIAVANWHFAPITIKPCIKQLVANPKVEIACYDGKGNTLRICGKAVFATSEETQKKALEVMPSLGDIYSVGDERQPYLIFIKGIAYARIRAYLYL